MISCYLSPYVTGCNAYKVTYFITRSFLQAPSNDSTLFTVVLVVVKLSVFFDGGSASSLYGADILDLCFLTFNHTAKLEDWVVSVTVDPRLIDGSTYRLFKLQTSLAAKFRFDLQPENQLTDQKKNKMEQKWNKNGQLWD